MQDVPVALDIAVAPVPVPLVNRLERSDQEPEPQLKLFPCLQNTRAGVRLQRDAIVLLQHIASAPTVIAPRLGDAGLLEVHHLPGVSRAHEEELQAGGDITQPDLIVRPVHIPLPSPLLRPQAPQLRQSHHVPCDVRGKRRLKAHIGELRVPPCREPSPELHTPVELHLRPHAQRHVAALRLTDALHRRVGALPHLRDAGLPLHGTRRRRHVQCQRLRQHFPAVADDDIGQTCRRERHRSAKALGRVALDDKRREGWNDLLVDAQRRVEPLEPRQAPELIDATVGQGLPGHIEAHLHSARRNALRCDGHRSLVDTGGVCGYLHTDPERPHLTLTESEGQLHRPAQPVGPFLVEARHGTGRDQRAARRAEVGALHRHVREGVSGGVEADLVDEVLAGAGVVGELAAGSRLDPAQWQVVEHPDLVPPVFGEDEVRVLRVLGQEVRHLGFGGADLHRVKAVELVAGLELENLGPRQGPVVTGS